MNPDPISDLYNKILNQDTDFSKQYITNLQKSIINVQPMNTPAPTSYVANTVAYQYGTRVVDEMAISMGIIEEVPKPEHIVIRDSMLALNRALLDIIYYSKNQRPRSLDEIKQYRERLVEIMSSMYNDTGQLSRLMYIKLQEPQDGQTNVTD